jgi:hypothetical protein
MLTLSPSIYSCAVLGLRRATNRQHQCSKRGRTICRTVGVLRVDCVCTLRVTLSPHFAFTDCVCTLRVTLSPHFAFTGPLCDFRWFSSKGGSCVISGVGVQKLKFEIADSTGRLISMFALGFDDPAVAQECRLACEKIGCRFAGPLQPPKRVIEVSLDTASRSRNRVFFESCFTILFV